MPTGFENPGLEAAVFAHAKYFCEGFEGFDTRFSTGRDHLQMHHLRGDNGHLFDQRPNIYFLGFAFSGLADDIAGAVEKLIYFRFLQVGDGIREGEIV